MSWCLSAGLGRVPARAARRHAGLPGDCPCQRGGLSTTQGYGPFATGTLNDALFGIQTFVALCALVGMVLCADLAETSERKGELALRQRLWTHWVTLFVCIGMTVLVWHMVSAATEYRARTVQCQRERAAAAHCRAHAHLRAGLAKRQGPVLGLGSGRAARVAPVCRRHGDLEELPPGCRDSASPGWCRPARRVGRARRARRRPPRLQYLAQDRRRRAADRVPGTVQHEKSACLRLRPAVRAGAGAAALQAEASGETALTGRLTLVQETGAAPQAGFLMLVPVYRSGSPIATVPQRRAALHGVVYSPFRMEDLMQGILRSSVHDVALEIIDGDQKVF
ncbi:CHASE domain-containing protein [Massilia sp. B-10]|nr:CHASE domain-containing protein [Massilia sp. B-10]